MNLERVSNEDKLELCRKYYLGGFALLPFLWLVNVLWFFREAFVAPPYGEQPLLRRCHAHPAPSPACCAWSPAHRTGGPAHPPEDTPTPKGGGGDGGAVTSPDAM
ncbi:gamma-secretase subunit PEN-2 isoform X1 [Grus americana]|uniref:gamma-secretase subunit PEN-2 isoform X1 n=1 Tax=Grus americana TaxID=9117 RepID=UPI00240822F1|nr:gamma-secretase subunit PEN-2 isoform X1 [Grus americana]